MANPHFLVRGVGKVRDKYGWILNLLFFWFSERDANGPRQFPWLDSCIMGLKGDLLENKWPQMLSWHESFMEDRIAGSESQNKLTYRILVSREGWNMTAEYWSTQRERMLWRSQGLAIPRRVSLITAATKHEAGPSLSLSFFFSYFNHKAQEEKKVPGHSTDVFYFYEGDSRIGIWGFFDVPKKRH